MHLLSLHDRDFLDWCQFQKKNKEDETKRSKAYLRTFETAMAKARVRIEAAIEKARAELYVMKAWPIRNMQIAGYGVLTFDRKETIDGHSPTVRETFEEVHGEQGSDRDRRVNKGSLHTPEMSKNHPLFAQGRRMLETAQKIVESYHDTEGNLAKLRPQSSCFSFEGDRADTSQIIHSARQLGERFSLQMIVPGSVDLSETKVAVLADGGKAEMALEVFKRLPASQDDSWGHAAYAHVQAWSNLLKTVADV